MLPLPPAERPPNNISWLFFSPTKTFVHKMCPVLGTLQRKYDDEIEFLYMVNKEILLELTALALTPPISFYSIPCRTCGPLACFSLCCAFNTNVGPSSSTAARTNLLPLKCVSPNMSILI